MLLVHVAPRAQEDRSSDADLEQLDRGDAQHIVLGVHPHQSMPQLQSQPQASVPQELSDLPTLKRIDSRANTHQPAVVTGNTAATLVAQHILDLGGNAVDLLVAATFAQFVTAKQATFDFSAPAAITLVLPEDGQRFFHTEASLPLTGLLLELHSRYGSLPWYELVEPAQLLAEGRDGQSSVRGDVVSLLTEIATWVPRENSTLTHLSAEQHRHTFFEPALLVTTLARRHG